MWKYFNIPSSKAGISNGLCQSKSENFRGFISIYQAEGGFPAQPGRSLHRVVARWRWVSQPTLLRGKEGCWGGTCSCWWQRPSERTLLPEASVSTCSSRCLSGCDVRPRPVLWLMVLVPANSSAIICNPLLSQSRKMVSNLPKGSLCYFELVLQRRSQSRISFFLVHV